MINRMGDIVDIVHALSQRSGRRLRSFRTDLGGSLVFGTAAQGGWEVDMGIGSSFRCVRCVLSHINELIEMGVA